MLPGIRERVQTFLSELLTEYPDRGVTVMSSLAKGADQLVAEEALQFDIPLIVSLPMLRRTIDQWITDTAADGS